METEGLEADRESIRRAGTTAVLGLLAFLAPSAGPAGTEPPDIEGRWAQKMVLTSVARVPIIGKVESTTTSYLKVDLSQSGRQIEWRAETCDVGIDTDTGVVETVLPDRFSDAIPTPPRAGRLVAREDRWRLVIPSRTVVIGADLDRPRRDPLPTSPDEPSVIDADADGHPGATVRVEGLLDGRLYVVQRSRDAYRATIHSEQRIRGRVEWHTDRELLDSTNLLLGEGPPSRPHPNPGRSWFELVDVDRTVDCEEIRARRRDLFDR